MEEIELVRREEGLLIPSDIDYFRWGLVTC